MASSGEFGSVFVSLWLVVIPPCMVLGVLRAGGRRTRGVACVTPCRTECCWSKSFLSACIDTSVVGGPQTHDDAQGCTPGRTAGHEGVRGGGLWRRAIAGVGLPNHQADRRERDGTAGREPAAVPDFHAAVRQDVRQEPAEKLSGVQGRGAEACTAHFPGGESDRAVREAAEALVSESNRADSGGQRGEGGMAVGMGLTLDMPGEGPDLWIAVRQ